MVDFKKIKIAIVHDKLTIPGGAEKVLETLLELFPHAEVYTAVYQKRYYHKSIIGKHRIFTIPWLNLFKILPGFDENVFRFFFWEYPKAFESLDLNKYDLVISSHAVAAQGVLTSPQQLHVSYIHTPLRYIYPPYYHEFYKKGILKPFWFLGKYPWGLAKMFIAKTNEFRQWDFIAAQRPRYIVANSGNTAKKIKKFYKRDVDAIINPPVEVKRIQEFVNHNKFIKANFYLVLSRLQEYKKIDLVVKTFKKYFPHKRLFIGGMGPMYKTLKKLACCLPNIKIMGFVSEKHKLKLLAKAKALIFPGEEDFGIVMAEALAAGTPVIAYAKGGAWEIVNNKVGVFFERQTEEDLKTAIEYFEKNFKSWCSKNELSSYAKKFSKERFKEKFIDFLQRRL